MTNWTSDPLQSSLARPILVIDSWPLVATVLRGGNADSLTNVVKAASQDEVRLLMSEMNLGEIFYLVAKKKGYPAAEDTLLAIEDMLIEIVPVAHGDVLRAAHLKARHPISYADCFCANPAIDHQAPILTGDPDFLHLQIAGLLTVSWLGP